MKIPLCLIAAMALLGLLAPRDALATPEAPVPTAPELSRPRILGISHVALLMHDVEKSRAFYKDYLGFDEPFSLPQRDGTGLYLTWIKVNDLQSIELFVEKDDSPDRLHQISFYTDDAEGLRRYVASKGIKVAEKTSVGRSGNINFMLKDPDGHTVEIVQYLPTSWSSKDTGKHMPDTRISTHLRHFGFMVSDLAASQRFYGDILGFTETWRGSSDGKTLNWVNMKLPESDDYIEFMLYGEKPSVDRMHTLNHLSLEVPDVAKAEQVLKSRTLPPGCKATTALKVGINRKRQINTFDADGTRVEIMEPNTVDGKVTPSSDAPPPQHP